MARAAWVQRHHLRFSWRLLQHGVCDGCTLGPRGLKDEVLAGPHLCALRLAGLGSHTQQPLIPADLVDLDRLRAMDAAALAALGSLPDAFGHRVGSRGLDRLDGDEALRQAGEALAGANPQGLRLVAAPHALCNETAHALVRLAQVLGAPPPGLAVDPALVETARSLEQALGVGAATCSLSDLVGTDLVLLVGVDLGREAPVLLDLLAAAKARGTRVVVVADHREAALDGAWLPGSAHSMLLGSRISDDLVLVRPGGETAALQGVLKALLEAGGTDPAFIARRCTGAEALFAALQARSWDSLAEQAGTEVLRLSWLGMLLARARSAVAIIGDAAATCPGAARAALDLLLARRHLGRPGCGLLPVGALAEVQIARGLGLVGSDGPAEVRVALGGGPAPFDAAVRIHLDHHLRPGHLAEPERSLLLLPVLGRYAHPGGLTVTSVERRVRLSPRVPGGPSQGRARPTWALLADLAHAARPQEPPPLAWTDPVDLRTELEAAHHHLAGLASLRRASDWLQWGGPQLCTEVDPVQPAAFSAPTSDPPPQGAA